MNYFTVFVKFKNGKGTTHISSHEAPTQHDAEVAALNQTESDWRISSTCHLEVIGVIEGDVKVLKWDN